MSNITRPELLEIEDTITQLDGDIKNLAKHWARDCPEAWEDLAQEARLAIYQKLKENPACPRKHLFHHAKYRILEYRSKGYSVDGKLHRTHRRSHVWELVSLDDNPEEVFAENNSLHFTPHQLRPVEDLALTRVAYGELRGRLTEQQGQYLSLRLQGYKKREAEVLLGLSAKRGARLREAIRKEAANTLETMPPSTAGGLSFGLQEG